MDARKCAILAFQFVKLILQNITYLTPHMVLETK